MKAAISTYVHYAYYNKKNSVKGRLLMETFNLKSIVFSQEGKNIRDFFSGSYVCCRYRKVAMLFNGRTATIILRFRQMSWLTSNQRYYKEREEKAKDKVCISVIFVSYDHRNDG